MVTASRCSTSCRGRCGRRTSTRRRTTPSGSRRKGRSRWSTGRTTPSSVARRRIRRLAAELRVPVEERQNLVALLGGHHEDCAGDSGPAQRVQRRDLRLDAEDRHVERPRGAPGPGPALAERGDLGHRVAHAHADGHPAVTVVHDAVEGRGAVATHEDRRGGAFGGGWAPPPSVADYTTPP